MSQLTTHILDTSKGKPAAGVTVIFYQDQKNEWMEVSQGKTNEDGRITNLLDKDHILQPGMYKLRFETKNYFDRDGIKTFFPFVEIIFNIQEREHYHVPLLLNPFGYST